MMRQESLRSDSRGLKRDDCGREQESSASLNGQDPLSDALQVHCEEPNSESADAVAEGNTFLASGKPGRFSDAHSLVESAME